jgi:outer membrane protein assembly factor BamB
MIQQRTWLALAIVAALGASPAANYWPGFRGPTGQGIAEHGDVPVRWTDSAVQWKTHLPVVGWSSPIIHGDRVFVSGTSEDGTECRIVAVDRRSGTVAWNTKVFTQEVRRKEKMNSFATPTPVSDGERVYAYFGAGGAAAVDAKTGAVVWTNQDVEFYSQHGLGASPILYRDLLIMPFDGSSTGPDLTVGWQKPWDQSFIAALDRRTGKRVWTARRGLSRIAHVTPVIVEVDGRPELISSAGDVVQGFNPENGELLWTVKSRGEGVVPSAVKAEGLLITVSGFEDPTIRAVRPGGRGDVTGTHLVWEQKRTVPMIPSFVAHQGLLFGVKENGLAICLDAKTGDIVWQQRVEGAFSASPIVAAGRVYFLSEEGQAIVIEAGRTYKEIARSRLDGRFQASPAVAPGQLVFRSWTHLYGVGGGAAPSAN